MQYLIAASIVSILVAGRLLLYRKAKKVLGEPETKPIKPQIKLETRFPFPTEEDIRLLAYQKWENAQPSPKNSQEFWEEAEQELQGIHNVKKF